MRLQAVTVRLRVETNKDEVDKTMCMGGEETASEFAARVKAAIETLAEEMLS